MRIKNHRKFIRKASALIKAYQDYSCVVDNLSVLPQNLHRMEDSLVLDQSRIYLQAINNLARNGMVALTNRDSTGVEICAKASRLVNCYKCGSIPNKL